jgi:RNA recognition motif-containing protein
MGDLAYWMGESYLLSLFASTGEVLSAKIIRNKVTGYSEGYGFVEFTNNLAAQKVLQTYNGVPITGTDQFFKLNWASHSGGQQHGGSGNNQDGEGGETSEYSVFVGDLSSDVTDYTLQEFFRQFYPSVKAARVVTDPITGRPKGYGFVRFTNESERDKAMLEMNGQVIGSRAVRVSLATPKKSGGGGGGGGHHSNGGAGGMYGQPGAGFQPVGMSMAYPPPMMGTGDMHQGSYSAQQEQSNTTLYIGGIAPSTMEDDIRAVFSGFGEIVYIKIASGKACAFVNFGQRSDAERALVSTNGMTIKGNAVRVSWGRHHSESKSNRNRMNPAASGMNPYAQMGYYGYYYDPNQYYGYGMNMPVQSPAMMQMQGGMMPQHSAQMAQQQNMNHMGLGKKSNNATKPASVEDMNKSFSSLTTPYTVESNAFIVSVPPAASTLHQ